MSDKYPRTPHLPWSPGCARDDKRLDDVTPLLGRELVMTEKMDGSNVCLERGHVYARSHSAQPRHASFDALKALHATARWQIPEGWQVFGEWLWAQHSIFYDRLPAYLLVFGIREVSAARWLSWEETVAGSELLGLTTVPLLWRGSIISEAELQARVESLTSARACGEEQEGLVLRLASGFPDADFAASVAKWVRPSHVQTDTHWSEQKIVQNRLGVSGSASQPPRSRPA